jgi:restriction system protein
MATKRESEFIKWMGPILEALRELGGSGRPREVASLIAERHHVSQDQMGETMKSGQTRFYNQVAWARQYLVWEGLLDGSKHGVWSLSPKGQAIKLDAAESREIFLKWVKFHAEARRAAEDAVVDAGSDASKPSAIRLAKQELVVPPDEIEEEELLAVLRRLSPSGFERVCQRLLRESGFESVKVTGKSHDGGIDGIGILQLNSFVTMKVLFQCKRYKGSVSRAEVGDFRNAMLGRADKGIILTTGSFSADAVKEANRDGAPPIELVEGDKLVSLFEKARLGVKERTVFDVDHEFFQQFME